MIVLAVVAFVPCQLYAQDPANYEITINGKKLDVTLGREYEAKLESGETVKFKIIKKAIATYKDAFISFQHKSDLTISSTDLGDGVRQTMTSTALGTLILFQEYSLMNPSSLVDLMLQELTKEQINYGYKIHKEPDSKVLKDGTKLEGTKATLTYKSEQEYWSVLAYGKKDSGFLVIIKIDKENLDAEKDIIELMWKSLQIEF
jgi:hypothetical protein